MSIEPSTPPSRPRIIRGHREGRLGRSPFGPTGPAVLVAVGYGVAVAAWTLAGDVLPGGRWLAVHLFTLGVLSNLVLAFADHFGTTLTRSPAANPTGRLVVANVGAVLMLTGVVQGRRALLAVGATALTGAVMWSWWQLRRMRRRAIGARFAWIVRVHERAHGMFVHGALLGVLMGLGVLSGPWYVSARIAHLHVNVLGWGGLTLLSTLVFFGPTLARTRIEPGADERAAVVLRHGATGLSVGTLLLLGTGVGGVLGIVVRCLAAVNLGAFAWAATTTCSAVVRAALRSHGSPARWSVVAVGLWFPVVVWADVAVVAYGWWERLDALGVAVGMGVLLQAIVGVLAHVAPMLRGRTFAGRDRLVARFERLAATRVALFNAGLLAVVVATTIGGAGGAALSRTGWGTVGAVVTSHLLAGLVPVRTSPRSPVVSRVASRYRRDG